MNKFNAEFVGGIFYIAFMVGVAASDVGDIPIIRGEPYGWDLPLVVAIALGFPFYIGYRAGRGSND